MMQWKGVVGDGFCRGLSSSRCRKPGGGFGLCTGWAKSMSVVVPPKAAAIVPVWEIIGAGGAAEGHVQVRVDIDPAGDDQAAGGV